MSSPLSYDPLLDLLAEADDPTLLSLRDRQLRTLFEMALDGMAIADDQGRYLDVNPAACELLGLEREQLLGRCIVEFAEPGFNFQQAWQEFQQQEKVRGEFRLVRADGKIRIVEYAATANFLPHRHLSVMRDITERKQAQPQVKELTQQLDDQAQEPVSELEQTQAQLRESQQRLESILNSVEGVVWSIHPETFETIYINPAVEQIFGCSVAEFFANPNLWLEIIHPDDRHIITNAFVRLKENGKTRTEYRIIRRDGQVRWLSVNSYLVYDETGKPIRIDGITTDISDRIESESRLEQIARHIPGAIYQFRQRPDGTFHFPYSSKGIREIYGVSPEEVREDASKVFGAIHPDDCDRVTQSILESAENISPWYCEYRVCLPDGRMLWLVGNATPQREIDGSTLWHGYIRDITDSKRAEANNQRLLAILENTSDLISTADLTGKTLYLNRAWRNLLNINNDDDAIADMEISKGHPEWALDIVLNQGLPEAVRSGSWHGETAILDSTGREIPVSQVILAHKSTDGEVEYFSTTIRDISESKATELALRISENKFRSIIENLNDMVYIINLDATFSYVTPQFKEVMGYESAELLDKSFGIFIYPQDFPIVMDAFHLASQGEKVRGIEYRILHYDGNYYWHSSNLSALRDDEDGQVVACLGIARYIHDQKQAEIALQESNSRWELAIEGAGDGTWDWNLKTNEVNFSRQWKAMLGYGDSEIVNALEEWESRVHPDDKAQCYEDFSKHLRDETSVYRNEHRLRCKDGSYKWILDRGQVIEWDKEGQPLRFIGTHSDISDRKAAELEVEQFFSVALDLLCIADINGNFRRLNRAWETILGYSPKELEGQLFLEFVHPDDIASTLEAMSDLIEHNLVLQFTNRYRAKDGNYRYIEWRSVTCGDLIYAAARDITERKQAEIENWQMQNFLNSIIENIPNMLFVKDAENLQFLSFNKAGEELLGYPKEALIGKSDYDFFPPEEADFFIAKDRETLTNGKVLDIPEEQVQTRHQGTRILHTRKIPILDELGNPKYLLGISEDITERKQAEAKLLEITQLQQAILDGVNYTIISTDTNGIIKTINAAAQRFLGYSSAEAVDKLSPAIFHDFEEVKQRAAELTVELGKPISPGFEVFTAKANLGMLDEHEWTHIRKDGSRFPVQLSITALRDKEGIITGLLGIARDITERKQAEAKVKEISERLSLALKSGAIGCWEWDIVQNSLFWDERMYELYGVTKNSETRLAYEIWTMGLHPDDRDAVETLIRQAALGQAEYDTEFRVIHPDGSIHFIKAFGLVRRDTEGNPQKMIGVNFDISDRKQAEILLEQSQKRYETLAEASPIGVYLTDAKGDCLYVNQTWSQTTGLTKEQAIGPDWARTLHPEDRERVFKEWYETALVKQQFQSEYRFLRPDSSIAWVIGQAFPLIDSEGEIEGYVGTITDISDRKQAEINLRQNEQKYYQILDAITDMVLVKGPQSRIVWANKAFREYYAMTNEQLQDMIDAPFNEPDYTLQYIRDDAYVLETGQTLEIEEPVTRYDGKVKLFNTIKSVIRNEAAEKILTVGVSRDITDRKRQEQALRLIVEGTAAKTGEDFFKSCVQYLAQALEVRYAFIAEFIDSEKLSAKTLAFWAGEDFAPNFTYNLVGAPCENVYSEGELCIYPNSVQSLFPEDDDLVALQAESYAGLPIMDAAGNRLGLLAVLDTKPMVQDIEIQSAILRIFATRAGAEIERIKAEVAVRQSEIQLRLQSEELTTTLKRLQTTQTQLIQSEKMSSLGQLVAGVAHEINNPVSFIYGNLQPAADYATDLIDLIHLYQEHYPSPPQAISKFIEDIELEYLISDFSNLLESMKTGATRISDIVKSLRTFSRLDEADLKKTDINENIESTLIILQNRLNVGRGNKEIFVVKNYGTLPLIECYGGLLNQVFLNLLVNSIDAIEQQRSSLELTEQLDYIGCITITTSINLENQAIVSIRDNGCGMIPEVQEKIFNPFFTTKPVGKGTGMGLATSYQIVNENHRGRLRCCSTPGEGTEFIIELPICEQK